MDKLSVYVVSVKWETAVGLWDVHVFNLWKARLQIHFKNRQFPILGKPRG